VKATVVLLMFWAAMAGSCLWAHGQEAGVNARSNSTQASGAQAKQTSVTEYTLPPEKLQKAKALYETGIVLYLAGTLLGIFVLWMVLRLRIGAAFRTAAERASGNGFLQALIFVPLLMLSIGIITLPLEIYGHHISREYGLSVQGWGSWAGDWLKTEAILLVIMIPTVWGLYRIVRKSPQRWWFYFWLLSLPFVVLLVFVAPVILDPIFNTFVPLGNTQPQLVSAIEKVTQRGGLYIPADRMFEMKASEKVTTYNAYVTGIGATKRVVVWDNTARDMTVPETMFIFGHEMGHYVLDHIYKGLAFYSLMTLIGFWLGRKIVLAMIARWGEEWRIREVGDMASLALFLLVLALLSLVADPIDNAFSRHLEHQADIYGLEVTHGLFPNNNQVAAESFQKLGEKSFDYPTPNPLLVLWLYDHPTIQERVGFSLRYDPWDSAVGPKYVK
jgi:STE24 endopeptidase